MILKSYIVEQNVEVLKKYEATLIYGENKGIKDDVVNQIKEQSIGSEIITLFEHDILKTDLLYECVANQSLFTENKLIFIQEASEKIFNQIEESLNKKNKEIQICIISENLEKKSKLRNLFEKSSKLAIFPCYKDNERTLINYINNDLRDYKGLTGEIINLIINNSNLERRIIKNELIKIKDFFLEKKINKSQLSEILNIKNDSGFDELRDKALMGEKIQINKLLSETEILNEETFFYLSNLHYRILRLHEIMKITDGENNYEEAIDRLKPPIFWKDKPVIIRQLKKWSKNKLEEILIKIGETEILMKKNSYIRNDIIIKDLILRLVNKATTS
jgi:DNA polymerase III subunit delta